MIGSERPRLILASGSATRRQMLLSAGVPFDVVPATIDERALREELRAADERVDAAAIASALAAIKAESVSRAHPGALVIGSDQVLSRGGEIFEKPATLEDARRDLMRLRGRTHELHSAVALAEDGTVIWNALETARLAMRQFSAEYLDRYLAGAGDAVCASVGCYQIEGLGVQLFERVEGDHFTILGMPLLPLLAVLRDRGVLLA